jgi:hypothetical protein
MFVSDQATNKSNMITSSFEVETDIVHFSYTNSNNVMYARYQNLAWTSETVAANAGGITYDDRTSLQLDESGDPYVSFKVNDGTNTALKYRYRSSANNWSTETPVQTLANTSSMDTGLFNEIAINALPTIVTAYIAGSGSSYGFYMSTGSGSRQVTGSSGQFTDAAVAIAPSTIFGLTAQSGALKIVNMGIASSTISSLPSGCTSVQKVSAVAKNDNTISVAIVCSMATSCGVYYGDITYSAGSFSSPGAWTTVGTIKSSSCSGLADSERPSIMVDRQNSNAIGIAWGSQVASQCVNPSTTCLNFWTNRSGSGVNTQVAGGGAAYSEQSLAFDSFGRAYIVYKDSSSFMLGTNNSGSWVTSSISNLGGGLSAIGHVGITGMRGRGTTSSGK